MGTITNPEPSQPAPAKPPCSKRRLIVFSFIFFIVVGGYVAFTSRHKNFEIPQNERIPSFFLSQEYQIYHTITKRAPQIDSEGFSNEYQEVINNELDLLRLSYKELRKEREVMAQQIEELRRQLEFVQTTHHREVEMLRAEILQAKKELLLVKQELARNLFDEKLKHKFNEDVFSSKNKEDVKSKPQEWIENVYQTASEGLKQAANGIGDTAKSGFEKVKTYVDKTAPKVSEKIKVSAQETIEKVKDLGQQVGESAKEVGKAAKDNFEKVKDFVEENVPKVASQIGKTAKESFETVKDYVGKTTPKVADKFGTAAKDTLETLKSVGEKAKETSGKIADQAKELVDSLFKLWKK